MSFDLLQALSTIHKSSLDVNYIQQAETLEFISKIRNLLRYLK